jgi:hypothetical protein
LGVGQFGTGEDLGAKRLVQGIGGAGPERPHLIGQEAAVGGAVAGQIVLDPLDKVFVLTARAAQIAGDALGIGQVQGGDDEAGIVAARHHFGLEDAQAVAAGKQGLIVYSSQKRCADCHKLIKVNVAMDDIAEYTRQHFDVLPIDIWGVDAVTALDGQKLTERDFSYREGNSYTRTFAFYDTEGQVAS